MAVVGGPLRTGRAVGDRPRHPHRLAPHGATTGGALVDGDGQALGIITSAAIRGTTVVIPIDLAMGRGRRLAQGGARQGFIGISSTAVNLPRVSGPAASRSTGCW